MFSQRFLKILDNMPRDEAATWSQLRSEFQKLPTMTATLRVTHTTKCP